MQNMNASISVNDIIKIENDLVRKISESTENMEGGARNIGYVAGIHFMSEAVKDFIVRGGEERAVVET